MWRPGLLHGFYNLVPIGLPHSLKIQVPVLSLTLIDSLKLILDKALQPILHFFARMSA